jgi:hypothetical protein
MFRCGVWPRFNSSGGGQSIDRDVSRVDSGRFPIFDASYSHGTCSSCPMRSTRDVQNRTWIQMKACSAASNFPSSGPIDLLACFAIGFCRSIAAAEGVIEACPLKPKRAAVQTITAFHGLVCSFAQYMATLIETIVMILRAASFEREHSMIQLDLA